MAYFKKLIMFFLQDISLKNKLLITYIVLIIVPLGCVTYLSYQKGADIAEEGMVKIADQYLDQAVSTLNAKLANCINVSNIVSFNYDLVDILGKNPESYTKYEQSVDVVKMRKILLNSQDGENIYSIKLYLNPKFDYAKENINFFSVADIENEAWYQKAFNYDGKILWIKSHKSKYIGLDNQKEVISAVRIIKDFNDMGKVVGLISVDMDSEQIKNILRTYNLSEDYLVDESGNCVFNNQSDNFDKSLISLIYNKEPTSTGEEQTWKETKALGKGYIWNSRLIKNSGWSCVSIISIDDILAPSRSIRNYSYILMIIFVLIAIFLAYIISYSISNRLRKLTISMRKVKTGNLSTIVAVEGSDEIGELQGNFSSMLQQISELAEKQYILGQELKNAELKALQAQINPHFLYNTLELINWKAIKQKAHDISFIVSTLADFYKISLNKGKSISTVEREIEHVEKYLQIQNKRFKDAIIFEKEIDEEIYKYHIPNLTLQPIVENAVLHGILEKKVPKGSIIIIGRLEPEYIILEIHDDGKGIESYKLSQIIDSIKSESVEGYGIKNVDLRIKNFFGEKYGLSFKSTVGQGTVVTVCFPAVNNYE